MFFFSKVTVFEGSQGLHFHKGKLAGVLGPGEYRYLGKRDRVIVIDTRPQYAVVGGQDVATSDGGALRVSITMTHQVADPEMYFRSGQASAPGAFSDPLSRGAADPALHHLAQSAIREWVCASTFREAFDQRMAMAKEIEPALSEDAQRLGVKLLNVDLLDMTPVGGMRAALFDLLRVQLEGESALARARNEAATMRNLLNTARLVREHPGLLELRVLSSGQKPKVTFVVGDVVARGTGAEPESSPE